MNTITSCRPLLGTLVEVSATHDADEDSLIEGVRAAFSEIERIQRCMSFHDPESELSRINREAHTRPIPLSPDMEQILRFSGQLFAHTEGAYDITMAPLLVERGLLPRHDFLRSAPEADWSDIHIMDGHIQCRRPLFIDLGGVAKGYAVDRAVEALSDFDDVTVNAGGDLRMSCWDNRTIRLRNPADGRIDEEDEYLMRNTAVATSASYFLNQQAAIYSPFSRKAVEGHHSVSVFASTCMVADAMTKVAFLMPDPEPVLNRYGASLLSLRSPVGATFHAG
ncbi:MAG: FAD:protein FMN transferase [Verrucomicrobiota bacterium]